MIAIGDAVQWILAALGHGFARAVEYAARHPWVVIFVGTLGLSGLFGWMITELALLVNPMRGLFLLLYMAAAPAAVFSVQRGDLLSRRVWVGMLASVVGLLSFRVIYDLIGLPEGMFRSNLTGIFGLVCGATGFLKVR